MFCCGVTEGGGGAYGSEESIGGPARIFPGGIGAGYDGADGMPAVTILGRQQSDGFTGRALLGGVL